MTATFMTVTDVAARWSCDRSSVYRLIDAGHLQALRIGRSAMRVPATAVRAYESAHTTGVAS